MNIRNIRDMIAAGRIKWSVHCLERMGERDISVADVKSCIANGEIIEAYPDDYPYPSCLIFGPAVNGQVIHVVAGSDMTVVYIITAYTPNTAKFEKDLKTRRS